MANDENELKKLFSNISEVFDQDLFDQDKIKQEPIQNIPQMNHEPLNQLNHLNQQQFNHYAMPECQIQKPQLQQQIMFQPQNEMSPAAQTLKNMAQQHQVKNSMNYMRPTIGHQSIIQQQTNHQRIPYQAQQFNNYSNQFQKTFAPDMVKQEIMMRQQPQMTSMHQIKSVMNHQVTQEDIKNIPHYQQSYQSSQFNHQNQQRNNYNGSQNPNMINIAMKQQMQFNGSSRGNVHIQGGQQMTGRMGDFSIQQQQQMYFNQQYNNQRPPGQHHQTGEGKV